MPGSSSGAKGHAYLHSLVPWIVLLIAVGVGGFLWALGRALSGQRSLPRYTLSLTGLWLVCSGSLVALYFGQEFLEGLFATGHPAGPAGIFGHGGWWSVPVALCIGLVLATVFHGARWVLEEVVQRAPWKLAAPRACSLPAARPSSVLVPRLPPLAGGWSGRGPS